jgi:tetratricopeptide (TPR) repeat protein
LNDSNSIVIGLINAVTGNLVTDGLKALGRRTSNLAPIRAINDKFGNDAHPALKDIVAGAMAEALEEIELEPASRRGFLKDKSNQAAWFSWVIQPESADLTALNVHHYAANRAEARRLEIFARRLLRVIKRRREHAFSPEARVVLDSVDSLADWVEEVALRQTETIVETVERTGDWVVDEVKTSGLQLTERMASLETVVRDSIESESDAGLDVSAEVSEAQALLDAGRTLDARKRASGAVLRLESSGGAAAGELASLYKIIANTYIIGQPPEEQRKASPYLREAADRTPEPVVRLRMLSLAALLEEDLPRAVEKGQRAVAADPTDFKATTALANAYIASGQFEDSIRVMGDVAEVAEDPFSTLEHGKAWVALGTGDPESALCHAEAVLNEYPDHVGALSVATEAVTHLRSDTVESGVGSLDADGVRMLKVADQRASRLIQLVDEQRVATLTGSYFRRSLFRMWLSREREAKADLERANKLIPGSKETLRNLASASLIIGDTEDAIQYAEAYEAAGGDAADATRTKARAHLLANNPELAVDVIKPFADLEADTEDARMAIVLLVEAYDRDLRPEEAERVLDEMRDVAGGEGFYQLIKAERYERLGDPARSVEDARVALSVFNEPGPYRARSELALANALYARGVESDYKEAAGLYALHSSVGVDEFTSRRWALALFHARELPECLRVCRKIQAGDRFEVFSDLEATIYLNTNNFALAADRFKWLAKRRPQNVRYALNYGLCLYRLGNPERAYHTMRLVASRVADSAEALSLLSDSYATVGKYAEAVQFGYEALQLAPDDYRFHRGYISLFTGPHFRRNVKVEDRYVRAFHKSLNEYNTRFPEHPFFERFETPPDDPETFKAQIIELFEISEKDHVEEAFRTGQFPIGVLARAAGKDVVAAWGVATSNSLYGLYTSTGDRYHERAEEEACRSARAMVLDPAAALALRGVGVLESAVSAYNSVLVPQALIDDLSHIAHVKRRAAEEGERTIHVAEGEVYRQEVPAEAVKRYLEFLDGLRKLLLSGSPFEVIGQTPGREPTFGSQDYDQQKKALGEATTEAMYEAKSRSAMLLAGDVLLRYVLASGEEIASAGPVPVLAVARERGALNDNVYHDALLDLIRMNYRFIRISSDLLARSAVRGGFLCTEVSTQALLTLSNELWEAKSVFDVLADFLRWLWGKGPTSPSAYPATVFKSGDAPAVRRKWTETVLDALANRMPRANAAALVRRWRARALGIVADLRREREYIGVVEQWLARG